MIGDPYTARAVSRMFPGTVGGQSRIASPVRGRPVQAKLRRRLRLHTVVFNYTGAEQTFRVPGGVTELMVNVRGAAGNDRVAATPYRGGLGGLVLCTLPVTPLELLSIYVGGHSETTVDGGFPDPAGGFNGGGGGAAHVTVGGGTYDSGGGGGASDIRQGGNAVSDRMVVGGGGGGVGTNSAAASLAGGHGGDPDGANGATSWSGRGATQFAAGAGGNASGAFSVDGSPGVAEVGGAGAIDSVEANGPTFGGGGGGGFFGGGGGGAGHDDGVNAFRNGSGGGGGSSWADPACTDVSFGVASVRDAQIVVSYYA